MSVIELDGLKNFNNVREIKLPGIENTWKIKFDDNYRVQSSLIATQVDKLYQEQSSDDYEYELLDLSPAERRKRLASDMNKFKKACVDGLSALLQDDEAGEEIYKAMGNSTEICAQIIGKINQTADEVLNVAKDEEKTAKYDTER